MPETLTESAFFELFANDRPLLDVRAPLEFERGAFPSAKNLPLLLDDERHEIGKHFKNAGQQAAIKLAHEIVSGENKEQRLESWQKFLSAHPAAVLYCFRGGLRSHTVQQWMQQRGIAVPLIEGGYKALRRYLINSIDKASTQSNMIIVGGKTGSGKTHLINNLNFSIDLEGLANHRGSAFGRRTTPQPSQIDFENQLGIALLKLPYASAKQIFLEDESRAIGSLSIPKIMHDKMNTSPIAMLEKTLEERINTIFRDYIFSNYQDFTYNDGSRAKQMFSEFLLQSLQRIRKRLGEEKYLKVHSIMEHALHQENPDEAGFLHRKWIDKLLKDYYDPMYEYQMNKKLSRVIYRGTKQEFLNWASHLNINKAQN